MRGMYFASAARAICASRAASAACAGRMTAPLTVLRLRIGRERRGNGVDDLVWCVIDCYDDRALAGARLLQRRELAFEQFRRHEVACAACEPLREQGLAALEKHERDVVMSGGKDRAVGPFESRAGDDDFAPASARGLDRIGEGHEPRASIVVVERIAAAHLLDIGGRVKRVAFKEVAVELAREPHADRALAGAGDAHQNDGDILLHHALLLGSAGPPKPRRIAEMSLSA